MLESHVQYVALCYHLRSEKEALLRRLYNHKVKCLGCRYLLRFSLSKGILGRSHRPLGEVTELQLGHGGCREMSDNRWKIRGPKPFRAWLRRRVIFLANYFFPVQISRDAVVTLHIGLSQLLSCRQSTILSQLQRWIPHPINAQEDT